ncbi:MAG: hypothetical protein WBS18_13105 [Candidatus Acidiferrales bacterium]|jgi:predicted RNA-binding Zn-ribbon protein involved in translation (DUF1610 family)
MERKYGQRGYQDRDARDKKRERGDRPAGEPRPKQQDLLGPRTPRMVGTVMRARCSSCGAVLAPGFDQNSACPRCAFELHSCKQCVHFDTGKQFECTQPIPERIAKKDAKNDCTFFEFRMTVEKDTSPVTYATATPTPVAQSPSRPNDARKAFEDLFKK